MTTKQNLLDIAAEFEAKHNVIIEGLFGLEKIQRFPEELLKPIVEQAKEYKKIAEKIRKITE